MRKLSNLFGIALLALAGITISSCSDDDESTGKHISGDQSFILKISSHVPADSLFEDNQSFRARLSAAGFNEENIISISGKDSVDIKSKLDATMKKVATNLTSKNETPFKLSVYRINNDATEEKSSNVCWYEEAFNHGQNSIFKSVNACEFKYDEKTLYATDIAIVNKDRGSLKSMPSGYSQVSKDLNDGAGGDYIYMGIRFEEYKESHKNQYITDVITLASTKRLDNNYTINYNGRTYKMATGGELDLNAKAGGDWIYIMYTRDEYKVKYYDEEKPAYLVSTAEDGYVEQYYTRLYNPDEITNTTRLVYSYTWFSSMDFKLSDQNIGKYDRCVKMIDNNGKEIGDADFNRKAGGEYLKMVCSYDYAPVVDLANWTKYLKDDTYISDITIPGTHDSYTYDMPIKSEGRDQQLNIKGQWEAGVRAFDVRIGFNYVIRHGPFACFDGLSSISMEDGYKMIKKQLDDHKDEFAIVFTAYETMDKLEPGMPDDWRKIVRNAEISIFGEENIVSFRPDLTVYDVRGKIVLVHQNPYPTDTLNEKTDDDYEEWLGSCSERSWHNYPQYTGVWSCEAMHKPTTYYPKAFIIQNNYEPKKKHPEKIDSFKTLANAYFDFPSAETWAINELSGYTQLAPFDSPDFAENVNKETYPFIKANKGKKFGIVLGDYMGVNNCKYEWTAFGVNARPRGRAVTRALIENNERFFKSK